MGKEDLVFLLVEDNEHDVLAIKRAWRENRIANFWSMLPPALLLQRFQVVRRRRIRCQGTEVLNPDTFYETT